MKQKGEQRIGLVLVSGDTAFSLRFASSIGRLAKRSGSALFVFAGGMPTKEELEGRPFTGIILFVDPLVLESDIPFDLSLFGPIPCVLVNASQQGTPSITCNLYPAAKQLLQHCLEGRRQVACIQGPAHNALAKQSFQAYREALAEHSIPLDFKLVSDIGISELTDQRALVPGSDFDAIYCFSDEVALSVSMFLKERGFSVPLVIAASRGGDSLASAVLPIAQMALPAWEMVISGISGDRVFDCEVLFDNNLERQDLFTNTERLLPAIVQAYDLDDGHAKAIEDFIDACTALDESVIASLKEKISLFLAEGGSVLLLQRLLFGFSLHQTEKQSLFFRLALYASQEQTSHLTKRQTLFSWMQAAIADTSQEVSAAIGKYLAPLGIKSWYVVQQHVRRSVVAGSHRKAVLKDAQFLSFDLGLLPPSMKHLLNEGCWLSIPLGRGSKTGYILLETLPCEPELVVLLESLFTPLVLSEENLGSDRCIVAIGEGAASLAALLPGVRQIALSQSDEFFPALQKGRPALLIVDLVDVPFFKEVRSRKESSATPIVLVKESLSSEEAEAVLHIPHLLMVHSSVASSRGFLVRLASLIAGEEVSLPTMTAALVKGALVYIDEHGRTQFSRWELAEAVSASEDYLGRIFREEMGLPLWDYLHIHRIALATDMLKQTHLTITEIAHQTGFKDLAYFSRVYRRVVGSSPSQVRLQKR